MFAKAKALPSRPHRYVTSAEPPHPAGPETLTRAMAMFRMTICCWDAVSVAPGSYGGAGTVSVLPSGYRPWNVTERSYLRFPREFTRPLPWRNIGVNSMLTVVAGGGLKAPGCPVARLPPGPEFPCGSLPAMIWFCRAPEVPVGRFIAAVEGATRWPGLRGSRNSEDHGIAHYTETRMPRFISLRDIICGD